MVNKNKSIHIQFYRTIKECKNTNVAMKNTANLSSNVVYEHNYKNNKNCWIYKVTK